MFLKKSDYVTILLAAIAWFAWFGYTIACTPTQLKENAAEATYLGQHLRCVDGARTLEESKACRKSVDERWGIVTKISDAGAD